MATKKYAGIGLFSLLSVGALQIQAAPTVEEKLDVLTEEVERLKKELAGQKPKEGAADAPVPVDMQVHPEGPTGYQRVMGGARGAGVTKVGGYGEMQYRNLDSAKDIDFRRFVLFFGHNFSDRIRFFSELELEHAFLANGEGKGEIELEQAFLEFDLNDRHVAQTGLMLVPVGILNEVHEPTTFYGVDRNPVETWIIPTTWREGGAGLKGEIAPGWGYDFMVTSGLNVGVNAPVSDYNLRESRQSLSKSVANDLAYTGRVKWTGLPGVELAATLQYQNDLTQGIGPTGTASSATLFETHAVVSRGPLGFRALYARWDLNGAEAKSLGRNRQQGWYIEPSYKVLSNVGVFARYNEWDNQAGDGIGSKKKQTNIGVNYWPHDNVVLKADLQKQGGVINDNGFNLGVGYQF